jgi:hypothetical protein
MSASFTPSVDGLAVIGSEQGRSALPSAGFGSAFLIVAAKIPRLEKRGDRHGAATQIWLMNGMKQNRL